MSTASAFATVAVRANPKRRSLLVSPILGKHVPVHPDLAHLAGVALGLLHAGDPRVDAARDALVRRDLELAGRLLADVAAAPADVGPVTVIGFAETATALGHSAATALKGSLYLQTTRSEEPDWPTFLAFQEEHSHAPAHTIYAPPRPITSNAVLLVDDEVTTARTALNLIAQLRERIPARRYAVASLIEQLGDTGRARVADTARQLGCEITTAALSPAPTGPDLGPTSPAPPADGEPPAELGAEWTPELVEIEIPVSGGELDARRGLDAAGRATLERLAGEASRRLSERVSPLPSQYLGVGEFMYLPMRIAAAAGPDARVWSTTRSPIRVSGVAGYPIQSAVRFGGPDFPGTRCFLYNFAPTPGTPVCLVFPSPRQRARAAPLLRALGAAGAERAVCLTFVNGSGAA